MGIYLNPTNNDYQELLNSKIVVDKSLLIEKTNDIINTKSKNICVSRPRRFGKSTDANMLVAYYSKGCDSHGLFDNLQISQTKDYEKHLNQYNVIHLNMQEFLSDSHSVSEMIEFINEEVIHELTEIYSVKVLRPTLKNYLNKIMSEYNQKFIFIIDEWDCIFREYKEDKKSQESYLDFLRNLLKDKSYVSMCYMTGILPIKKYGTHSALNMFDEISMIQPESFSEFMGFTEKEVKNLCKKYDINFNQMREWYDGYHLKNNISIYSPRSVSASIQSKEFNNYWSQTETFEALKDYIDLNFDGLKDNIISMVAEEKIKNDTTSFQNDMSTFHSKDDVLTLLIHLGYLGYNGSTQEVYIPNNEVKRTFVTSIKNANWDIVTKVFKNANDLLEATWNKESDKVAQYIQEAHYETSILQYNKLRNV